MAEQATTLYRTNAATFELPTKLKDKTMHIFALTDDGPSEFSMVISHAELHPDEELEDFSERLVAELGRALPKFDMKRRSEQMLDGAAAIELSYSWRNDGHFMHQRQVIAILPALPGASRRAMLIAATCMKPFNEEWNATFDAILSSLKISGADNGGGAGRLAAPAEGSAAVEWSYFFVFSERRRMLRVFSDRDEACRNTDAREVEQDAWTFFDASGLRLYPRFVVPNTGTLWRKAGSYVLEARADRPPEALQEYLHQATILQVGTSGAPFRSIGDVLVFLDQQKAG